MRKLTLLLLMLVLALCIISVCFSAQAVEKQFDYQAFEGSPCYTFDAVKQEWKFNVMKMIQKEDDPLTSYTISFQFNGKISDKMMYSPPFVAFSKTRSDENIQSVVFAVSTEKYYRVESRKEGSDIVMLPLTEIREDMINDLANSDAMAIVYSFASGDEESFVIQGEEYKEIKEYCSLLVKANALFALEPMMASTYDNLITVETITKFGNEYTASNRAKAVSEAKEYLQMYYSSYDGLVQYLQKKYSYEDAVYAADRCDADWNEEALGAAKSMIRTSNYSYDALVQSMERKGFTHEQAIYAADNCGGNWTTAAVKEAKDKLKFSNYSYDGLIKSLQYKGYSYEDAKTAVDQCGADWMEQAAKEAKEKLKYSCYSYEGLIKSLQYAGFSYDEAKHGTDLCGADWNQQALGEAKNKLKYSNYSYNGLIKSLQYADFTYEQAKYGADECGANWMEQAVEEAKNKLKYSDYTYDEMIRTLQYAGFTYEESKYGAENCEKNGEH